MKVAKLRPVHVREWHSKLVKEPDLHLTTIAKVYRLLRSILNTAVEDELIDANPCRIKNGGVEHSTERPIPTVDELRHLADAMPSHLAATVWLAALGGLRKGEVLGLARRHVNLEDQTVTIERSLQEVTGSGSVLSEPKTLASNRVIVMPAPLFWVLVDHLEEHVESAADALLFTNSQGRPVRASVWSKAWQKTRDASGLHHIRFHDLRHLAGTLTAQAGGTLKEIMAALGHTTPSAALRYQHVAHGRSRILADRIGETIE